MLLLYSGRLILAQTSGVTPRIPGNIDNASVTILKGNVSAKARPQFDQGEAPATTQLTGMRLVLSRSSEQEAALKQFMAEQLEKSSPNYHKWLTPEQFGESYGPADSDITAIAAWLQSMGLTVDRVSPGRTNIAFSGTVQQVEQAFHTSTHIFNVNGESFLSNTTDPSIPSALAAVVKGVAHLNTIQPRPQHVRGGLGRFDQQQRRLVSAETNANRPGTELTSNSSGSYFLYVVAADAATIYDTPNSFNANFSSGTSYTGKGVTIGIGGDAVISASTVVDYRSRFLNGDTTEPTITNVDSNKSTEDADEAYIDTELAGGLAPGATIHFYTSSDLSSAIEQAISDNTVDIFSLSFGECEAYLTTSDNEQIAEWWQEAASQGIVVTVSSGDNGSAGCDNNDVQPSAVDGLQVSGYASTPYNIAVGGTDYYKLKSEFTTYVGTTSSYSNSSVYYRSALSYIPESTWNDSTKSETTISNSVPYTDSAGLTNIVGGSGGASSCSTNSDASDDSVTCTSGYSKPAWQNGTGVPSDSVRDLPDVSLMAGNGNDDAAWAVCTDDTSVTSHGKTVTSNCTSQSDGNFYVSAFGGTSTSAPAFAGILALVQQSTGSRLGLSAVKSLYDLNNGSHDSSVFHDVTVGNNSVICVRGSTNCSKNSAGYYFLSGYDTGTGYDQATGLGSVDATQLINYWSSATGSATATVTATPSSTTVTPGESLTVSVTVSGSSSLGTPIGTVTLTGGGYTSSATTLSSGAATITIPAGSLSKGTDTLTVTYSGDVNYASATGSTSVTVATLTPTVSATPASTSIDTAQSLNVSVSVSGSAATPTGTVSLSGGGYTSSSVSLSSGSATITIPGSSLSAGTDTLTVTYGGDSNYSSGSTTTTVTVTQSTYSLSATTPVSVNRGSSASSTVTVSSSTAYSGKVSLSCSLTSSPSGATNSPACTVGSPSSVTLSSSTTSANSSVTISTTSTTSNLDRRGLGGWAGTGGGAVLALLVFFGMPARRARWRSMLGALALFVLLCSLAACSGSSSGNTGTTAGTYTYTVTGTGDPSVSTTPKTTITVTVN